MRRIKSYDTFDKSDIEKKALQIYINMPPNFIKFIKKIAHNSENSISNFLNKFVKNDNLNTTDIYDYISRFKKFDDIFIFLKSLIPNTSIKDIIYIIKSMVNPINEVNDYDLEGKMFKFQMRVLTFVIILLMIINQNYFIALYNNLKYTIHGPSEPPILLDPDFKKIKKLEDEIQRKRDLMDKIQSEEYAEFLPQAQKRKEKVISHLNSIIKSLEDDIRAEKFRGKLNVPLQAEVDSAIVELNIYNKKN